MATQAVKVKNGDSSNAITGAAAGVGEKVTTSLVESFISRITGENRYFGRIELEDWRGSFFKHDKYPRRWSAASQFSSRDDDSLSETSSERSRPTSRRYRVRSRM